MEKIYQPCTYLDDGTNIDYGSMPNELHSFQAFPSREDCERWLENNGYDPTEYAIIEYDLDDIEDPTIINGDGEVIECVETYVYDVGVLDEDGEEIDEVYISAHSEKEMWSIFDEEYKGDYPNYDSACIYDVN